MRNKNNAGKTASNKKQTGGISGQTARRGAPNFFYAHRYFFLFFIGSVLYHMIVSTWFGAKFGTDGISYTLHIINYDFGFCSKLLPGTIFTFFFPEPTKTAITVYESALLVAVMTAVSAMLEKLMLTIPEKDKKTVLFLIVLYLGGSATFSMMFQELGLLDAYWIYISVLLIPCVKHRFLRFLLPVFYVLAVMIHFGAVVSYIPFFSLLVLYEISLSQKKKDRTVYAVLLSVSILLSAAACFYFMMYERQNLKYDNVAEFNDALTARGADYFIYFDYTFFDDYSFLPNSDLPSFLISGTFLPAFLEEIINKILMQIYYCYLIHKDLQFIMVFVHLVLFLLLLPVYISVYRILIQIRKACENKLKRVILFCALFLAPVTYISGVLFSTDPRWAGHAYLLIMTFLLYILYRNGEIVLPALAVETDRRSPALKIAYLMMYGVFVFEPYI